MSRKWFIVVPLVAVELLLCAGILAVFWGGYQWVSERGLRVEAFGADTVSAESDETQTLPVSGPATLTLDNTAGSVTVTAGTGSEIVLSAHKTVWGATEAEAQAALADLKITVTQTGNAVTIKVVQPAEVTLVGQTRGGSVDFTLSVPADTALDLSTGFGEVTASGVTSGARLHSSSGTIEATDVAGDLVLTTDFGDVTLERAAAGTVEAGSSSGQVTLRQVEATGAVALHSDFGDVSFGDGSAASVAAKTSSGAVTLRDLSVAGAVEAHSDFGDLSVTQVDAADGYDLGTSSGAVTLTGATGTVKADTGFGDILITEAETVTLDAHSSSGSLTFAGSLGARPHSLRTDFGDILLRLPADATASFDFSTDFGSLNSALPVTLTGELDESSWQGTLGGGGPQLTVHTSSGSIRVEKLSA